MNTRLEKLEKIRLPAPAAKPETTPALPITQTIIINNPNININYLNNDTSRSNGPLSSRGIDNWSLNNNLKEFSQTRQLGFFKGKRQRNKSNSPYFIHKVRTQDIRSINKIYAPIPNAALKETLTNFRKNETISHIQPQNAEEIEAPKSSFEKIINKRDKTITEKFYQGQIRKNLRVELQKNFETLPTNHLANPEVTLPEPRQPKNFRRGKFELPLDTTPISVLRPPSKDSSESISSPEKAVKMSEREDRQADSAQSETKEEKKVTPRIVSIQLRKRAFNRTIASIDKMLLGNTDDYLQKSHRQKLPQSQIQLFVNSISHPEHISPSKDKSFQRQFNSFGQYDFQFEQQRKKRPKTPKRKKFYDLPE